MSPIAAFSLAKPTQNMFLLCSRPTQGPAQLSTTPPFDAEDEERATREIAHYRELSELGMKLARAAAARALAEPEQPADPAEKPAPGREPNPHSLFLRHASAVRAAHTAEHRAATRRAEIRAARPAQPAQKSLTQAPHRAPEPAADENEPLFPAITRELGLATQAATQGRTPFAKLDNGAAQPKTTRQALLSRPYVPP